jgi:hypothetical protein
VAFPVATHGRLSDNAEVQGENHDSKNSPIFGLTFAPCYNITVLCIHYKAMHHHEVSLANNLHKNECFPFVWLAIRRDLIHAIAIGRMLVKEQTFCND